MRLLKLLLSIFFRCHNKKEALSRLLSCLAQHLGEFFDAQIGEAIVLLLGDKLPDPIVVCAGFRRLRSRRLDCHFVGNDMLDHVQLQTEFGSSGRALVGVGVDKVNDAIDLAQFRVDRLGDIVEIGDVGLRCDQRKVPQVFGLKGTDRGREAEVLAGCDFEQIVFHI